MMKVHYTGKQAGFTAEQQKKIDSRVAKLAKLLDGKKGEKEARVVITTERHLKHAEITVNYYNQQLVSLASEADVFTAVGGAFDKLEKQLLKARTKWRDGKRTPAAKASTVAAGPAEPAETEVDAEAVEGPLVNRVNHKAGRKPMTLDEAVMSLNAKRDYVVYRDSSTDRLSILVRRRDGNLDLIEE